MEQTIYHIYDKIFKKIITLSSTAIVNLINGLFGTDYPSNSTITYNWTEFENDNLKRILADTIITVNNKYSYHLEAQMYEDETIIFRVFEYGFNHANRIKSTKLNELIFPEPIIIYLYYQNDVPDEYILTLNFGTQGTFDYKVKTFKYLDSSIEEILQKKLVILIPFQLLKLRKLIEKERNELSLNALKNLIQNDIIGSIDVNLKVGNITLDDARRLKRYTHKLYNHIYSHYNELEVLNEMTDESLMLDIDYIEKEHEEKIAILEKNLKKEYEAKLSEKDAILSEKDAEIAKLKAQLANIL